MSESTKYLLQESDIPTAWYNIVADLPEAPPPVLHPGTGQPITPGRSCPAVSDGGYRAGSQQ